MRRSQDGKMKGTSGGSGGNNLRTSGEGSLGGASSKASKVALALVISFVCFVGSFLVHTSI